MNNNFTNMTGGQMHSTQPNGIDVTEATSDTIKEIQQIGGDVKAHLESYLPHGFTVTTTNQTQNGYVEVYVTVLTPLGQQVVFSFRPVEENTGNGSARQIDSEAESIKEISQEFAAEIIGNRLNDIDGEINNPVAM